MKDKFVINRIISDVIEYNTFLETDLSPWIILKSKNKRKYFVCEFQDEYFDWDRLMTIYEKFKSFRTLREAKFYYLLNI